MEENKFVHPDEIIDVLLIKTRKGKGTLRLYLFTTLNRLKKQGKIVSIKISNQNYWGFPNWLNIQNKPFCTHEPKAFHSNKIFKKPFGIGPSDEGY